METQKGNGDGGRPPKPGGPEVIWTCLHPPHPPVPHLRRLVPVTVPRHHQRRAIRRQKEEDKKRQGDQEEEGGRKRISASVSEDALTESLEVSVDHGIGTASGDSDQQKWLKWLAFAWNPSPKLDDLNKVKKEFGIKMCLAMTGTLDSCIAFM